MNIFIDVRLCSYSYQGLKTYIENILPYILESEHTFFLAGFKEFLNNYKKYKNVKPIYFEAPINSLKEQILGIKIKKEVEDKINIYFFPYPSIPVVFLNKNFVVILHDVTPYKFWYFYNPIKVILGYFITKIIAKKTRRIIAVSNSTANDLVKYFNIPTSKISVVYDGVSENFRKLSEEEIKEFKKRYGLEEYLLYVGNRERTKNIFRLLEAVKRLREERFNLDFIIIGRYFKSYVGIDKKILSYGEWVRIFYNIPFQDLVKFYNAAKLYIHPALNEGFGLPVLEAMKCGCICVVSDIPVFRELFGNDCFYFNPHSSKSIYETVKKVLTNNNLKMNLEEENLTKYNKYNWQESARKILQILESCGGRHG